MKTKIHTKLYQWQERCKAGEGSCIKCGELRWLTVDHIVPIHFLEQLGMNRIELLYDFEDNFEILCRYCNQEKASRLEPRNPKTYSILRAVLDKSEREALFMFLENLL